MSYFSETLDRVDRKIVGWMGHYGPVCLRISLGIIFIWFGGLKLIGQSPANELVARTVYWIDPKIFIPILGWWEIIIGVGLLYRPLIRMAIFLLFLQMPGTMLPLFILPEVCFNQYPWALTIEGQYIIKNLVLVSAALVVGGTVRRDSKNH